MSDQSVNEEAILKELANSVVSLNEDRAASLSREAVERGVDAYKAISEGLARGMETIGEGYEKGIYYVPDLLVAADAMYAGINVLRPHFDEQRSRDSHAGCGVIGVIEGDTHDIGKNLVMIMLEAAGFRMVDLGRDVPPRRFVEAAAKEGADVICISSLITTAMPTMEDVISALKTEGIREKVKVMVGGACVSPAFAKKIGADAYAHNAAAAVRTARLMLKNA